MQQAAIQHGTSPQTLARRALGPVGVSAVALAVALAAIGVYGSRSSTDQHLTREFLIVLAIITIAASAVFGWIVPKLLERDVFARPALALSVLGLATVVVFWSGLPPILAAGGGLLGWTGRNGTRGAGLCRAAFAIAVLAVAADIVALVLDMTT